MVKPGISFIGAGKVAAALCSEIYGSGYKIVRIVSRTEENCRKLAESCNASWSMAPYFEADTDLILIAVPDDKIGLVASGIKCSNKTIIAHTAGSAGLDVFPDRFRHVGVFYPLQTFTIGRKIRFGELPFFIEGSDDTTLSLLCGLAEALGSKVHLTDEKRRRMLHLSAVFVNNFINHMLVSGKEIASMAGFNFEVLIPLINETIRKAIEKGPENSQTGPAVRSDLETIGSHIKLLSFSPDLQNIYREITDSIMSFHKTNIND
ncbi:MAG: DUF2520 domain-containing protein [Bacteroidales bacterium]|nr:DUF2520 domain-containing protein [Bacteroidales bacterium]